MFGTFGRFQLSVIPAAALVLSLASHATAPVQSGTAGARTPHERYQQGVDLLDEGEFAKALPIYRELTASNPVDGWNWLGLGWSLHYTGDCAAAIPAYLRAIELGAQSPYRMTLEIARCSVALGRPDEAMTWLRRTVEAGHPNLGALRADEAFASLAARVDFRGLLHTPAPAAGRIEGWHGDLRLLASEIKRLHYDRTGYAHDGTLDRDVEALRGSAPSLSDDEMALGVMRIMRRLGDGHSWAVPAYMASTTEDALPLLFGYFEDGIFVTATAPAHRDLLWSRVVAFDATPADRVFDVLSELVPQDNRWRPRALAPMRMRFPRLLASLGLTDDPGSVTLAIVDRTGASRTARVESATTPTVGWVRHPDGETGVLPAHVRRRDDRYWFEYRPESRTMYLQYNACLQKSDERMEAFARRFTEALGASGAERLVVDLRWNGGGNQFVSRPLRDAIMRSPLNQRGRLFVLAGPHTFSAAIVFAAELERYTEAIFIGEPTGASPNFTGETNIVRLPHSGIAVSISNLHWQNSVPRDARTWIPPLLYVPARFDDYRRGLDPVFEAAAAYPAPAAHR